jgi:ribosome-associated protein
MRPEAAEPFRALARRVLDALEDRKAQDVRILDLRKVATYADLLVICSGTSSTHVQALVDGVEDGAGERPVYVNRSVDHSWWVLDYIDVVVHVFREDLRGHYGLETLWSDAGEMDAASV